MRSVLSILLFVLVIVMPTLVQADYLTVSRNASIKIQPERGAAVLQKVSAGSQLQLLNNGRKRNGYYKVKVPATSQEGWIYRNRVRRVRGTLPVSAEQASRASLSEILSELCLHGCPAGASRANDLVVREIYLLSNNEETKLADWVSYKVTADTIGSGKSRNWKRDPMLDSSATLSPKDYQGANAALNVDRGHQAPLASFSSTENWYKTNFLSNITPQSSVLNQGPWKRLEGKVRDLARRTAVKAVYVMTGPLYERNMAPLPNASLPHTVPSAYWKIVATRDGNNILVSAFYFDQDTAGNANICGHLTTVDDIERRSGLDFFYVLGDDKEDPLESRVGALAQDLGCTS